MAVDSDRAATGSAGRQLPHLQSASSTCAHEVTGAAAGRDEIVTLSIDDRIPEPTMV
jgi:hypothetical protein